MLRVDAAIHAGGDAQRHEIRKRIRKRCQDSKKVSGTNGTAACAA
jgi:hypothetical protein